MPKLILGLTGEMGSGKGTVSKHVTQEYKGSAHRFSTLLRDVLDRIYVDQSRDNLQKLSNILRKNFGEDLLSKSIYHDTHKDEHEIVVVDGVRRMADIEYLSQVPYFKLVYIDSDIQTRYERVIKRGENPEDAKKTLEEFKRDNKDESELQIRDLKSYANYTVDNNGTFVELYKQIDDIIKENLK